MTNRKKSSTFPDQKYLHKLAKHMREQGEESLAENPLEAIQVESGKRLNWIADYLTDKNMLWKKVKKFPIRQLILTGTNPDWNAVILDQCNGSPEALRTLLKTNPEIKTLFAATKFDDVEILIRLEEGKYSILDGMHRVIAAIRDGKTALDAFIAIPQEKPQPQCEPHVVYDFLRSYQRGINQDRTGLIIALKFLLKSYSNVKDLLRMRFGPSRLRNKELQEIIQEVLQ